MFQASAYLECYKNTNKSKSISIINLCMHYLSTWLHLNLQIIIVHCANGKQNMKTGLLDKFESE